MQNILSKFARTFVVSKTVHILCNITWFLHVWCLLKDRKMYALKVQRNMCICVYKNIINKHFILYKYVVVYYITCYTIFYYFI